MDKTYYFIYNGNFVLVTGEYQWNSEIMENLGTSFEDYIEGEYVLLNEEQTAFLEVNKEATPEEAWNMNMSHVASSKDIKTLIDNIKDYDSSAEVNTFYVNGAPVWFSKEVRGSLNNSLSIEKEVGKEVTILWINGTPHTMSVEVAKQMLIDLELYAIACYNNTQQNIAEAQTLSLKSEISEFDITKGYPDKLNFYL